MLQNTVFMILCYCILCTSDSKAQIRDSLLNNLAKKWANAKTYTLKIAELMPDYAYAFKPTPQEMSFGEQLQHIAQNMNWLSSAYLSGPSESKKKDSGTKNKHAVIQMLSAAYDSAMMVYYRLSSPQLDEVVSFFAGPMTRRQILILMHDHQTHHVGQLIVYLRLQGIKPPDYIGW